MLLEQMITNIRIEIGDEAKAVWTTDDPLIRGIEKSIAMMSRLIPNKAMVEVTVVTGNVQRLDISDTISDFIRIDQVEYPYNEVPPSYPASNSVGTTIFLTGSEKFTTGKKARVIYLCKWTPPTPTLAGDYPSHLDDAVIIGSAGQVLIYKAEAYIHLAAGLIASGATAVSGLSSYITAVTTALDSAKSSFAASITTLSSLAASQLLADAALDKVAVELAAGKTYLTEGDAFINKANRGAQVGALYAQYAEEQIRIGNGYIAEAEGWDALIRTYIEKSTREGVAGQGYTTEGAQRLALIDRMLGQAERQELLSVRYLELAGRCLASGQSKINEFIAALGFKPELQGTRASVAQPTY